MESPNSDQTAGLKRKRSPVPGDNAEGGRPAAVPGSAPPKGVGSVPQINYLVKAKAERLRLIEGDSETFGDVLGMIDDYEGVLQRHESLAANLGAKLVGPLLLKSFEKLFDGPIKVVQQSFALDQSPVSWLDIVTFARTNPSDFVLGDAVLGESIPGMKACRFWIKGGQVEISEDDYRLIQSGAPERMIPTQPIPEDEAAELGTLNILENRLAILIKKADAVASKARQLNYHLKGRKVAVLGRKPTDQPIDESRHFSPQPFSAVNARSSIPPNGESGMIQQQLLEQFQSLERRPSIHHSRPKARRISTDGGFQTFSSAEDPRRMSHPLTSPEDGTEGQYRVLMASKIEKLSRGDAIYPPCDRCRRLKFDCTKHLTACQACTKKHAKCSWKDIKEGELDYVPHLSSAPQQPLSATGTENGLAHPDHIDPGLGMGALADGQGIAIMVPSDDGQVAFQDKQNESMNDLAMLTHIAAAASSR